MLYFLLRLETNFVIKAGTPIVQSWEVSLYDPVSIDLVGNFWNGDRIFSHISDEYEAGKVTDRDIYDIAYQLIAIDADLHDEVSFEFNDLFKECLVKNWEDLNKPIVFLMSIMSEETYTDMGYEYDTVIDMARVLNDGDFAKLAKE